MSVYKKENQIDHVLNRPDMYLGNLHPKEDSQYVYIDEQIISKKIKFSPGMLRIFIEMISNSIDNFYNSSDTSTPCKIIRVDIDSESGQISVWNDGCVIPVVMHSTEKCYNHSLVFGQLLTSSNYDDAEKRSGSGRNGYGIKIANIFGKKFDVEGCDPTTGKILKQTWTNNMKETDGPTVTSTKAKKGYTKVTWTPDIKRFKFDCITDDMFALLAKHVADTAMLVSAKVFLNGTEFVNKTLASYAKLYNAEFTENMTFMSDTCHVVVIPSSTKFEQYSFVNGIHTKHGGIHVDRWTESIFRPLVEIVGKKLKKSTIKIDIGAVKKMFKIFVKSSVSNPEFESQEKNKLERTNNEFTDGNSKKSYMIDVNVPDSKLKDIMKWEPINKMIEDSISTKDMESLQKIKRERGKHMVIENLTEANNAGKSGKGHKCILMLCEGKSACTFVTSGVTKGIKDVKGQDWIGTYPLTGKILNTRNNVSAVNSNVIVKNLMMAINLIVGVDYTIDTNFKKLRYGSIGIAADADVDGLHIKGLVINLIHHLFPSVLKREKPFIFGMETPIARIDLPAKKMILFYDERKYISYVSEQIKKGKKVNSTYYKGLGSLRPKDTSLIFGEKIVDYILDENTDAVAKKVFETKNSGSRKKWISEYDEKTVPSIDDSPKYMTMTISDFLDNEMIKFSIADCERSIPNMIDGLKVTQRKILHAAFKRNLVSELKVANLAGYVAEHTNYHHGDASLNSTIIGMAGMFVGNNNIPLLTRGGQFGTRLENGKDAASPRYTSTSIDPITRLIYREEDSFLLEHVIDDGDKVEPTFFIPIIPMILVNGCATGIGTGWSCNVPMFNPVDVINEVRKWINYQGELLYEVDGVEYSVLDEIVPWYHGFTGVIERDTKKRYVTHGIFNNSEVTELPVGISYQQFSDTLDALITNGKITGKRSYSTTTKPHYIIEGMTCSESALKLDTYLQIGNMVMFDDKQNITRFDDVPSIVEQFCIVRLECYVKRLVHIIKTLKTDMILLSNRERFIQEVIDNDLVIQNIKEVNIIKELEDKGYDKIQQKKGVGIANYGYLLGMDIRSLTSEKVEKLKAETAAKKQLLNETMSKTAYDVWDEDLNELEEYYKKWVKTVE
jgi:DNA topoisomerase-2